jgi:predicted ATP-dependent serine protease
MPATPGGRKAPVPPERAKQAGVTLLTGHFVGRADELSSLERILDELDRGCPGAIELAGEPGIGKTRLLTELAVAAMRNQPWFLDLICPASQHAGDTAWS